MSYINAYFDKVYCINLDKRYDRWHETRLELGKFGIDCERVSAVAGNPGVSSPMRSGAVGCAMSHLKVCEMAKSAGFKKILILEDDVVFCDDFDKLFETYVAQVPSDWKLLYAGGNHLGSYNVFPFSTNVVRINNTYTTHFVGLDCVIFDEMIDRVPRDLTKPIDQIYAEWQRKHPSFCITPHLVWQRAGYSDIDEAYRDYDSIIKEFKTN